MGNAVNGLVDLAAETHNQTGVMANQLAAFEDSLEQQRSQTNSATILASAAEQTLKLNQTAQLKITIIGFSGLAKGKRISAHLHIENVGNQTVYDITSSSYVAFAPLFSRLDTKLLTKRGVDTLAPHDAASYIIEHIPPDAIDMQLFQSQKGVVQIAGRVVFYDASRKRHVRYVCQIQGVKEGLVAQDECPTPPQS